MKISDSKLNRICFFEKFRGVYELKEDIPIVLNNSYVYAIKDDCYYSQVDFDISNINGKRYICPQYHHSNCDYFLLAGERLAMCKTVEIKAEDYIDVTKFNGDFTFVLEDNK